VLAKIERACALWNEGEKALAHIHPAHAGLPPCGEDKALPLAEKLFVEGGQIETLEGYTYDEPWPKDIRNFRLRLIRTKKRA
jgi:hypothetical protein